MTNHLPPIDEQAEQNAFSRPSVPVLVRVAEMPRRAVGVYCHALKRWEIDDHVGPWNVLEWWPLPDEGTGQDLTEITVEQEYRERAASQLESIAQSLRDGTAPGLKEIEFATYYNKATGNGATLAARVTGIDCKGDEFVVTVAL